jgi:cytochrome c2
VARWVAAKRLRGQAARGATVFAREGCLSCHRYLGSGRSRFGGRELTNGGPSRRSAAGYAAYVADPEKAGNALMPGYGDLAEANLRAIGAFLVASRSARS